jgi:hypothetical protein
MDHHRTYEDCVRPLTKEMRYDVPDQDLRIVMSRMPPIPFSRL